MKKIRVLALVMVFAFAALGGAYAMWYDSLFLNTTVKTGSVDVCWVNVSTSDDGKNYARQSGKAGENIYQGNKDSLDGGSAANPNPTDNKNIGSLNAVLSDDIEFGASDARAKDDVLTVTLENGYPGYQEYVTAGITNKGTVPVKFRVIKEGIPDWLKVSVELKDSGTASSDWTALEAYQLDPGQTITAKITYRVNQNAPQGNTGTTFKITLKGIQWNEYSPNEDYKLKYEIVKDRIEK